MNSATNKHGGKTMINQNNLDKFLGDTNISDFESLQAIENYFSMSSLCDMFGSEICKVAEVRKAEADAKKLWESQPNHFIVKTASCTPSSSCWGKYARVAVLECEHWQHEPKMISTHAKGVVRVVETWENCNVGLTERCAFRRALKEAQELCDKLNNS
jgi:hypothetical protein